MCKSCQNEIYDSSVGYEECACIDKMTEEEYDKYFCEQRKGCPYYKAQIDEYEYAKKLGVCI